LLAGGGEPRGRYPAARKWDPNLLAAIAGIGAVPALGLMTVDHDPFAENQ
jgi:hypothetical protein